MNALRKKQPASRRCAGEAPPPAEVILPTAWGGFRATLTEYGVCSLFFPGGKHPQDTCRADSLTRRQETLRQTLQGELEEYLAGRRKAFSMEPDFGPATEFQLRIWRAIQKIPYGYTLTYAQLAEKAGSPRGFRAAGQACGANPVPLVVPCHRVVAAGGTGGFSSCMKWKIRLLELEGR